MKEIMRIGRLTELRSLTLGVVDRDALPALAKLPLTRLSFALDELDDLIDLSIDESVLEQLRVGGRGIYDLRGLRRLANLRSLTVSNSDSYRSIDFIGYNSKLSAISLYKCAVTSISELASASKLASLAIHSCNISDYGILSKLPTLTDLDLGLDPGDYRDLSWSSMASLNTLTVWAPDASDLDRIRSAAGLTALKIFQYGYADIKNIPTTLHSLEIWRDNQPLVLDGIERMQKLEHFDASHCHLQGARRLLDLPELKSVWFYSSDGDFADVVPILKQRGVLVK